MTTRGSAGIINAMNGLTERHKSASNHSRSARPRTLPIQRNPSVSDTGGTAASPSAPSGHEPAVPPKARNGTGGSAFIPPRVGVSPTEKILQENLKHRHPALPPYAPSYDEAALDRFAEEGRKAWADVSDSVAWVRAQRGDESK